MSHRSACVTACVDALLLYLESDGDGVGGEAELVGARRVVGPADRDAVVAQQLGRGQGR